MAFPAKAEAFQALSMEADRPARKRAMFRWYNSVTDEVGYVFVATDLTLGEWEPEDTEELLVRRIAFDEAVNLVTNGTITDGISVAAILRLNIALKSGEINC